MRLMAKIMLPVESGNQGVNDGTIGKLFQAAAERWKPEAMYFGTFEGRRTGFVVFDMQDPSDMVPFTEPFFNGLNADVQLIPVMNADDLEKGIGKPR
jgi:hypothetical protein